MCVNLTRRGSQLLQVWALPWAYSANTANTCSRLTLGTGHSPPESGWVSSNQLKGLRANLREKFCLKTQPPPGFPACPAGVRRVSQFLKKKPFIHTYVCICVHIYVLLVCFSGEPWLVSHRGMAPGWGPHALEPMASRSHDWPWTRGLRGMVCPSWARASQGRGLCTCPSRVCRLEAAAATALEHGAARPLSHTGAHVTWSSHPAVSGQEGKGLHGAFVTAADVTPANTHSGHVLQSDQSRPSGATARPSAHTQGPTGTLSPHQEPCSTQEGEMLSLAREPGG